MWKSERVWVYFGVRLSQLSLKIAFSTISLSQFVSYFIFLRHRQISLSRPASLNRTKSCVCVWCLMSLTSMCVVCLYMYMFYCIIYFIQYAVFENRKSIYTFREKSQCLTWFSLWLEGFMVWPNIPGWWWWWCGWYESGCQMHLLAQSHTLVKCCLMYITHIVGYMCQVYVKHVETAHKTHWMLCYS